MPIVPARAERLEAFVFLPFGNEICRQGLDLADIPP
jgi:hypothetical protein